MSINNINIPIIKLLSLKMSENGEQHKEKENNSSYNSICAEVVWRFSLTNSAPNLFKNDPAYSKSNKSNESKADPSKAFEKTVEAINNLASKFERTMTSINNSIKSQNEFNSNLASKLDRYIDAQNKSNANLYDKFDQTLTAINSLISIQNNLLSAIKELIDKKIK